MNIYGMCAFADECVYAGSNYCLLMCLSGSPYEEETCEDEKNIYNFDFEL